MLTLNYLPANCAYVFMFGDAPLRLADKSGDFPMFYESRRDALAAAQACGVRAAIVNNPNVASSRA